MKLLARGAIILLMKRSEILEKPLKIAEKFFKTDAKYLASGGFWVTLAQIVGLPITFLISLAYANLLPKEIYGNYRYIISFVNAVSIFTLPGMDTAITRAVARGYDGTFRKGGMYIFFSSFCITLLCLGASAFYLFNHNKTLGFAFIVVAFLIPLVEGLGNWKAYLNGKAKFREKSIYNITTKSIYGIAMLGTIGIINYKNLSLAPGTALLIAAFFASQGIPNIYYYFKLFRRVAPDAAVEPGSVQYGFKLVSSNGLTSISTYLDGILLFHFLGAAPLAVYSFAIAIPEQVKTFFTTLGTVVFPKLAVHYNEKNGHLKIKSTLPQKILRASFFSIIAVLLYLLLAPFIYHIFFPSYLDSVRFSQIFALSLLFIPASIFSDALNAEGNIKKIYTYKTIAPISQIALLVILIPPYGIWGAVWGRVLGRFINYLLLLLLFKY